MMSSGSSMDGRFVPNSDTQSINAVKKTANADVYPTYTNRSLAIAEHDDEPQIRRKYRPFLLDAQTTISDWVSELELNTAMDMAARDLERTGERLKIMVLFGSLRPR